MPDPKGRSSSRAKERSAESPATNPEGRSSSRGKERSAESPATNPRKAAKKADAPAEVAKPKPAESKAAESKPPKAKATKSAPVPDQPAASKAETAADDVEASAEVAVPLNRAERRAKGKAHGQVQVGGRGKVTRSTGPAAGPRMWSNRRSG